MDPRNYRTRRAPDDPHVQQVLLGDHLLGDVAPVCIDRNDGRWQIISPWSNETYPSIEAAITALAERRVQ